MKVTVTDEKQNKAIRAARSTAYWSLALGAMAGYGICQWRHNSGFWSNIYLGLCLFALFFMAGGVWASFDDLKSALAQRYDYNPETHEFMPTANDSSETQ